MRLMISFVELLLPRVSATCLKNAGKYKNPIESMFRKMNIKKLYLGKVIIKHIVTVNVVINDSSFGEKTT
jgi:hypothetical protein